jgi:hypothetical protein
LPGLFTLRRCMLGNGLVRNCAVGNPQANRQKNCAQYSYLEMSPRIPVFLLCHGSLNSKPRRKSEPKFGGGNHNRCISDPENGKKNRADDKSDVHLSKDALTPLAIPQALHRALSDSPQFHSVQTDPLTRVPIFPQDTCEKIRGLTTFLTR